MLRVSAIVEGAGVPTSSLCCEGFVGQAKTTSVGLGFPNLPVAAVPGHVDVQTDEQLAEQGMSKDDVRQGLHANGRWPTEAWERSWFKSRLVAEDGWPDWVEQAAKTGNVPATEKPDDIAIVVAGGNVPIPQHVYGPSWGVPPARITREIQLPFDWQGMLADAAR